MGEDIQYVPQEDEVRALQGTYEGTVAPMTAVEQFPNPMGKHADIGNFRDVWWFVLWVVASATVITVGLVQDSSDSSSVGGDSSSSSNTGLDDYPKIVQQLAFACLLTSFFCLLHLAIMQQYPVALIRASAILCIAMMIGFGILFVVLKSYFMAIVFGVLVVINIFFTSLLWNSDRIFFAALCMQLSSKSATTYWGVTVNAFFWVAVQFGFFMACFVMLVHNVNSAPALFWLGVLVLYWGSEVFRNIVHVTTSGVVSEWFFRHMGPQTPVYSGKTDRPTLGALGRATTWSIGSICFGSLIVAIIRTIRAMLRASRRGNSIVVLLVDCLLGCIVNLMRYFNDYAYVQVAMFGKPYLTAASDTWKLVKDGTAWDALINDYATDYVYTVFIVFVTAIVASLTALLGHLSDWDNITWDWTGALVGALVAFLITCIIMKVIYSGVLTIFIGFWQLKAAQVAWNPAPLGEIPVEELNSKLETKYYA